MEVHDIDLMIPEQDKNFPKIAALLKKRKINNPAAAELRGIN